MMKTILFLLLTSISFSFAQDQVTRATISNADTSKVFVVKLSDGSSVIGRISAVNEDAFEVNTTIGKVNVPYAKAMSVKSIDPTKIRDGYYWFPNPNQTRLFLAPTGKTLKKGTGYYQNIYLFFNGFAYGVTDNVSLGGGLSIFPVEDFLSENVFYFTPKIGTQLNENISIAAGAIVLQARGLDSFVGLGYGVGTVGNETGSFTAGLGVPFAGDDLADDLVLMIGGDVRISRRMSLITENWFIAGAEDGLVSYGVRFFGEQMSIDLAFINVADSFIFPGWPYIDFVFNF